MIFDKTKIRCSSLGAIMTPPKDAAEKKRGELGATCKTKLIEIYALEKYGREKDISNRYIEKGLAVEESAISLFNLVDWPVSQIYFTKNEKNIADEFITGTPDLFTGKVILEADEIIDIKSSWDIHTFLKSKHSKLDKDYWWQLQGYMKLTGAKKSRLVYCLVNTPDVMIADEMRRLEWKMGVIDGGSNPLYTEAAESLMREMTFNDIPNEERVHQVVIERDDSAIALIAEKVAACRAWMNETFNQ